MLEWSITHKVSRLLGLPVSSLPSFNLRCKPVSPREDDSTTGGLLSVHLFLMGKLLLPANEIREVAADSPQSMIWAARPDIVLLLVRVQSRQVPNPNLWRGQFTVPESLCSLDRAHPFDLILLPCRNRDILPLLLLSVQRRQCSSWGVTETFGAAEIEEATIAAKQDCLEARLLLSVFLLLLCRQLCDPWYVSAMSEGLVLDYDRLLLREDRKEHKRGEFVAPGAMVSYHRLPQYSGSAY